ncbi:fungal-specific transcription factor domain-containing protein [Blakeslea trispora]|nr:fungal-specific transcription factor domain-containing protein [Blakeslea trispora]
MYHPNDSLNSQLPLPRLPVVSIKRQKSEKNDKKRTRKSRACDLCRRKKIRCDYDQDYPQHSCSSCKGYGKECAFNEASKKRGPPRGYVEGLESRLRRMEKLLLTVAENGNLPPEVLKATSELANSSNEKESTNLSSTEELQHSTEKQTMAQKADDTSQERAVGMPISNTSEPFSYVGSSSGIYLLSRLFTRNTTHMDRKEKEALPRPVDDNEEDLMIARFGGDPLNKLGFGRILNPDWKIPPKDLTDHLIQIYFRRINIMLPILDEDSFYQEYRKANHASTFIPIIMAICRSSCRLLEEEDFLVQKYNIDRAHFFRDIQKQMDTYFDVDFLQPKIETIQVLLISASNTEKWGIESSDWITTSIAVKMAQDLGLHRANTQHQGVPKKDMEAKKRLWWSAYIIDRWVCASLGRPLTISDADCDIDHPDPNDQQYTLFFYMVKLSCILGDVLRAFCSPRARLMSEKGIVLENISRSLEQMLLGWRRSLPSHLALSKTDLYMISQKDIDAEFRAKLSNGASQLQMAYIAVYLLIKRPLISMGIGSESTVKMPAECQDAIKLAVDLFDVMKITDLLCNWSLGSYWLSQTQMLLLLNFRNADTGLSAESKRFSERFKSRHHELSNYITQPSLVPFLELVSSVISGEGSHDKNSNASHGSTINKSLAPSVDQQQSLWEASNGIEWQEMVKLLAETGYQICFK